MSIQLLLALYSAGMLGLVAYYLLLPERGKKPAYINNGRLDFYTHGTGEVKKCLPYTIRHMVNDDRVLAPQPVINLIHRDIPAFMLPQLQRGVLIAQ